MQEGLPFANNNNNNAGTNDRAAFAEGVGALWRHFPPAPGPALLPFGTNPEPPA